MRKIIKETLAKVNLSKREFTQQIKKMEKEIGWDYYIKLNKSEWDAMFDMVNSLTEPAELSKLQDKKEYEKNYNIFRLAKYVVSNTRYAEKNFPDYLEIFLRSITHPYGNIRVTGRKLVNHLRMALYDIASTDSFVKIIPKQAEKNQKIYYPMVAEMFMNLQKMESEYQECFHDRLDPKEIFTGKEFIDPANTKDKILKSIRKWMEGRDVGKFDELMEDCGFLPIYESDGPWFCGGRYMSKWLTEEIGTMREDKVKQIQEYVALLDSPQKIEKERKKTQKAFELFTDSYSIDVPFEVLTKLIYNAELNDNPTDNKYYKFWFDLCERHNIEMSQNIFDLMTMIWNFSPHKGLDGKSPVELMIEEHLT